jgi:hypothetical protein
MKIIALLSLILLSACAKPALKNVPQPDCFAPAGFYMSFAGLQEHNCKQAPKDTLVGLREVKPDSLRCGLYRSSEPLEGVGKLTLIMEASRRGLIGRMLAELTGCRAVYEVVFLRMK